MPATRSPCIGVCALDSARRECRSCRRTIEEIVAWPRLDEAGRRAILARLKARDRLDARERVRAGVESTPCPPP
ncbi:DUF1289 domain-containing protein [Novosphingobium sp. 1949]|uniref:DUF1289 domain-containing protein n=1 Tax=Novosphingobium organovorum TaxID=2930092 RepID=A0ABT0BHR7_9SPHN|nr:DUF1289 domain-containing protein [Novosphingobium organovorum]MCJ2184603.1 DUF1289 domain-containing protein [Novosphingobium organovorum]